MDSRSSMLLSWHIFSIRARGTPWRSSTKFVLASLRQHRRSHEIRSSVLVSRTAYCPAIFVIEAAHAAALIVARGKSTRRLMTNSIKRVTNGNKSSQPGVTKLPNDPPMLSKFSLGFKG